MIKYTINMTTKMLDLVPFNHNYLEEIKPLSNDTSQHCYWNSVLQCLMSCSSFISEIKKEKYQNKKNFVGFFLKFLNGELTNMELFEYYLKIMIYRNKKNRDWRDQIQSLIHEQQCCAEIMGSIMDMYEKHTDLSILFRHRYESVVLCKTCGGRSTPTINGENLFQIPANVDFPKYIIGTCEDIDEYKCEKCSVRGKSKKITKLKMVPEILIIHVKLYEFDYGTMTTKKVPSKVIFPELMNISGLKYMAVAYVDHMGASIHGGHYVTTVKRKRSINYSDEQLYWYLANDDKTNITHFSPGENTYLMIYHYYT